MRKRPAAQTRQFFGDLEGLESLNHLALHRQRGETWFQRLAVGSPDPRDGRASEDDAFAGHARNRGERLCGPQPVFAAGKAGRQRAVLPERGGRE